MQFPVQSLCDTTYMYRYDGTYELDGMYSTCGLLLFLTGSVSILKEILCPIETAKITPSPRSHLGKLALVKKRFTT